MSWLFGNKNEAPSTVKSDRATEESLRHDFASNLLGRLSDYKSLIEAFVKTPSLLTIRNVLVEEARLVQRTRDMTNNINSYINQGKIDRKIFDSGKALEDYPNLLFQIFGLRLRFYTELLSFVKRNGLLSEPIKRLIEPMQAYDKYLELEAWEFLRVFHASHSIQNRRLLSETTRIIKEIIKIGPKLRPKIIIK
jgi:hypothetical protein